MESPIVVSSSIIWTDNRAEIAKAIVKAQSQTRSAERAAVNPHLKNKYADMKSILDACREAYNANGIAIVQGGGTLPPGNIVVHTTDLVHISGEGVRNVLVLHAVDSKPQSIGSAMTYARRYSMTHMGAIATADEDDDGNAASGTTAPPPPRRATTTGPAISRDRVAPAPAVSGWPDHWGDLAAIRKDFQEAMDKIDPADYLKILEANDLSPSLDRGKRSQYLRAFADIATRAANPVAKVVA